MNEFDLLNGYEMIYLFKEGNKKPIFNLNKKYNSKIKIIINKILEKFYNIPLEISDFDFLIYFSIEKAMKIYNDKYQKKFSNYLFQFIKWETFNLIKKFLNNKHKILNNTLFLEENSFLIVKNDIKYSFLEKKNNFLVDNFDNLNKLSRIERDIFLYKWKGKSNIDIMKITKFNYKKIDNAIQRSIKKLSINHL